MQNHVELDISHAPRKEVQPPLYGDSFKYQSFGLFLTIKFTSSSGTHTSLKIQWTWVFREFFTSVSYLEQVITVNTLLFTAYTIEA